MPALSLGPRAGAVAGAAVVARRRLTAAARPVRRHAARCAAVAPLTTDVGLGDRGATVKLVQKLVGVKPTGVFDLLTADAVKVWQRERSLPVSGYIGPMSRDVLNAELLETAFAHQLLDTSAPARAAPPPCRPAAARRPWASA